jgi:hypothetical protein
VLDVEVDEESEFMVGEFEVGEDLGGVDGVEGIDGFEFDDDLVFDE